MTESEREELEAEKQQQAVETLKNMMLGLARNKGKK